MGSHKNGANPYIVDVGANWFVKLMVGKQKAQVYDCNIRMNEIMSAMCQSSEKWDEKKWWGELDDLEHQIYKLHEEKYGCLIPLKDFRDQIRRKKVYEWLRIQIQNIAKKRKQTKRDVADMIITKSGILLLAGEQK